MDHQQWSGGWKHRAVRLPLVGQALAAAYRGKLVGRHLRSSVLHGARWALTSREWSNPTYDIEPTNREYLIEFVSIVTGQPREAIARYVAEAEGDEELSAHILRVSTAHADGRFADAVPRFGRRLGWYAIARATKPRTVIETGVDKGLGAVLLASAVLRNRSEGFPCEYMGTEINPRFGYLLCGAYAQAGRVIYGDSIESLGRLTDPIDLFINDSDHSADYERREYTTIASHLSPQALVLGDNAHETDALLQFARQTGRAFLFFPETPRRPNWYRGGGIGTAWLSEKP